MTNFDDRFDRIETLFKALHPGSYLVGVMTSRIPIPRADGQLDYRATVKTDHTIFTGRGASQDEAYADLISVLHRNVQAELKIQHEAYLESRGRAQKAGVDLFDAETTDVILCTPAKNGGAG